MFFYSIYVSVVGFKTSKNMLHVHKSCVRVFVWPAKYLNFREDEWSKNYTLNNKHIQTHSPTPKKGSYEIFCIFEIVGNNVFVSVMDSNVLMVWIKLS